MILTYRKNNVITPAFFFILNEHWYIECKDLVRKALTIPKRNSSAKELFGKITNTSAAVNTSEENFPGTSFTIGCFVALITTFISKLGYSFATWMESRTFYNGLSGDIRIIIKPIHSLSPKFD